MRIIMLGSGGWEGIPAPFCVCKVCASAINNPMGCDSRTRPGLYIEGPGGSFGIEIGPDIRLQSTRWRLPQLSEYFVSHWHFDHAGGLYELGAYSEFRAGKPLRVYCSGMTAERLATTFSHVPIEFEVLAPFVPVTIKDLRVTAFPVQHMHAADAKEPESVNKNVFGFLIEDGSRRVAYLADYYALPDSSAALLKGCDLTIADGTYLAQEKYGENWPEPLKNDRDHLHGRDIFEQIKRLGCRRTVFFSITHLTGKTHEELALELPKGFSLGFDGQELVSLLDVKPATKAGSS